MEPGFTSGSLSQSSSLSPLRCTALCHPNLATLQVPHWRRGYTSLCFTVLAQRFSAITHVNMPSILLGTVNALSFLLLLLTGAQCWQAWTSFGGQSCCLLTPFFLSVLKSSECKDLPLSAPRQSYWHRHLSPRRQATLVSTSERSCP